LSLIATIFITCGKITYESVKQESPTIAVGLGGERQTNLSRYSDLSEKTYRCHFNAGLGLEVINQALIEQISSPDPE
jgi:hypothetical protein